MLGVGGVLTELLDDVAIRLAPAPDDVVADDAWRSFCRLRSSTSARGGPVVDRVDYSRAIQVMGEVLVASPELVELEKVNPFGVTAEGHLVALDAVRSFRAKLTGLRGHLVREPRGM